MPLERHHVATVSSLSSLEMTMQSIHGLLRGDRTAEAVAAELGAPVVRLQIYRDAVFSHITDALQKNFETVFRCLSAAKWQHLARRFFRQHPPRAYELNESVAPFVDFLEQVVKEGDDELSAAHVEITRLEWAEFVAYAAEVEIPALATLLRPEINPTLTILRLRHRVGDFIDAAREAERCADLPPLPTEVSPNITFVFREPKTDLAVFYPATDALLFALKLACDGVTIAEAAESAALPRARVEELLRAAGEIGLILLPRRA